MKRSQKTQPKLYLFASVLVLSITLIGLSVIRPLGAAVSSVAASDNLLLNSQFKGLAYGSAPIDASTGSGVYFNNRWRAKFGNASSSATMQQINQYGGGTKYTISNTSEDYFYVRQTIPGVMQFSNKTFTVRADIANADPGLAYDFYVNARWNPSNAINITDTTQSALTSGVFTAVVSVGDLSGFGFTEDENGGLEIALRVHSPSAQTNAEVDIDGISFYEGSNLSAAPISDYSHERAILNQYYETAEYTTGVVGLSSLQGQKRATFQMTSHKRRGVDYALSYFDALGNEGKVSTYRHDGARFDNVTPDSVRKNNNSFVFVFFDTDISGIGLSWIADSEN